MRLEETITDTIVPSIATREGTTITFMKETIGRQYDDSHKRDKESPVRNAGSSRPKAVTSDCTQGFETSVKKFGIIRDPDPTTK